MKTVHVELPDQTAAEIDEYVRKGWFPSAADAIRTAVLDFVRRRHAEAEQRENGADGDGHSAVTEHRPIEDVIAEIVADVPDDEWDKLPADLTDNLDHYLYGAPKK